MFGDIQTDNTIILKINGKAIVLTDNGEYMYTDAEAGDIGECAAPGALCRLNTLSDEERSEILRAVKLL